MIRRVYLLSLKIEIDSISTHQFSFFRTFLLNILQDFDGAISYASKVLEFCPDSYEALWAAAKAKKEFSEVKEDGGSCNVDLLESALTDLRNAIRLAPQNLELHR